MTTIKTTTISAMIMALPLAGFLVTAYLLVQQSRELGQLMAMVPVN